ncbi:MAG: hypothetical protein CMH57_06635, partial [Myxococcales bacterium]|nr:hypothetical protein [Myxococcales bacterium]
MSAPLLLGALSALAPAGAVAQGRHPTASEVEGSHSGAGFEYELEEKLEWMSRAEVECDLNCEIARASDDSVDPLDVESTSGPFPVVSLTPYFPEDSPYHAARLKVRRGDCAEALKLLKPAVEACGGDCEGGNALALLQAEARWCAGEREAAWRDATALEARGYPGMELEVRALIETMASRLGKPAPTPLRPSIAVHGSEYVDMILARARRLSREKKHDAALALLERLEREVERPATRGSVRLVRAALLEAAGREAEAAEIVRERWMSLRSGKAARAYEARLERLAKASDEVAPP